MIEAEHLTYAYEERRDPVLRDLSLHIQGGEYVALIGPNGCGKTTLLRHLNGLLTPSGGEVRVDGLSTRDSHALTEIRQRVGMIFQNPDNQIVGMTVEEDVSFGPGNLALPPGEIQRRVDRALETVGLRGYRKRTPHSLSGGEKQLVAIAGVLAMEPAYIAFDEPTVHLDPLARKRIHEVIGALHRGGVAVIHVTHNMDEVVGADRVLLMNDGEILLEDTPARVFAERERLRRLGLDIPLVSELMWRLRQMGADVRPDLLNLEEACREISSLIRARAA
ncbi:MAG: energy-coupling factor transporter ATPase [Deltaproteobacteria bacterium]|nr:energy-coupling factor transporter ATPase [Deltaproteobacteria bacterium]